MHKKTQRYIENVQKALAQEKDLSSSFRATIDLLIVIVTLLANQMGFNSRNSSKPPSSDNVPRKKNKNSSEKRPGGQKGHLGSRLEPVSAPESMIKLKIDLRTIPKGTYSSAKSETRQFFDFEIKRIVTEYEAEVLIDSNGKRFVAKFPNEMTQKTQYGPGLKAQVIYDSQSQLIPYDRIVENLSENANQLGLCL